MKNFLVLIFLWFIPLCALGQIDLQGGSIEPGNGGSLNRSGNINQDPGQAKTVIDDREKPPITDYKIISVENDTTFVDTTLSIYKDYKYNYLRKDNFELLPFSNVGQTYNSLAYSFDKVSLMPDIGVRAKQFAFLEVGDIYYYNVPTPLTDLYFKTTFEQGQNVDAFFTSNMTPRLNLFIAYKGLRSLGRYQNILSSQGSFRIGLSYQSLNNRYHLKTHFISQELSNQENGGLSPLAKEQYESKGDDFDDRSVLAMNFEDAENLLFAKRFYLDHYYKLIKGNDSTANNQVRLGHIMNFTDKEYTYEQETAFSGFGETFENTSLYDETEFQDVSNTLYAGYTNNILGQLAFKLKHTNYNYGYRTKLFFDNADEIPNRLTGDVVATGATYANKIGEFNLSGDAMINLSDDFSGNYLTATAGYQLNDKNRVDAGVNINSRAPDFNFLLYQSDYINYNWRNEYDNIQSQNLKINLQSETIANLEVGFTQINNYTYFGLVENTSQNAEADTLVRPNQYNGSVSYLKLKAQKKISWKRFSLDNTLLYQNVMSGAEVMPLPDFVTRNALYYDDYWFDRALYLQTGFIFKYFTSYNANAYDPVLSEFYVQDIEELEGFYTLDFIFNAKVRQTRIFFKLENFTTIFEGNNHYAAPSQPYRDFGIRFGLVWNFFL